VGGYGDGWGNTGASVSVRQGGTLYIKYYAAANDAMLCYADHGRASGGWHAIGPALADGIGEHAGAPVILKISDAGTAKSAIAWVNGRGKSGIWPGLPAPGPYDLALHDGARWTVPPIVVTEVPKPPSFWSSVVEWLRSDAPAPASVAHSVPDAGASFVLFAIALVVLAMGRRARA
jgi:hypothetical protein